MKLLLDTHIVLWSLTNPAKLSDTAQSVLEDPKSILHVSSITVWEILVLAEKSKISLKTDDIPGYLRRNFKEVPFVELPINNEIAIQSRLIDLPQKDPADRFIAATALVHGMTLITVDQQFRQNTQLKILF